MLQKTVLFRLQVLLLYRALGPLHLLGYLFPVLDFLELKIEDIESVLLCQDSHELVIRVWSRVGSDLDDLFLVLSGPLDYEVAVDIIELETALAESYSYHHVDMISL